MNRREVVEFLHQLENKYPVETWRVRDVDVWPIIKIQTFFFWFEQTEREKKTNTTSKEKRSSVGLRSLLRSSLQWLKLLFSSSACYPYIFSGAASHRVTYEGKFMNRYFDPMMDYLEKQYHVLLIEQSSAQDEKSYYKAGRLLWLPGLFPLANLIIKLRYRDDVAQRMLKLPGFCECLDEIERHIPAIKAHFLKRQFIYMTQTILVWAFIFDRIFAKLKPRFAFGLCYYTLQMHGMNLSAHRNNILSIDMQHGTQGDLHVAYSNFTKIPSDGYSILPKLFWCWDNTSEATVKMWTRNISTHKVINGGNPWISFSNQNIPHQPFPVMSRKIVLYTLQPVEPLLDEYIVELIRITGRQFEWWLRLHPRQFQDRERLIGLLERENILQYINIDDASSMPLPVILRHTALHISKFSGSVIEASLMGVKSIVIDEIGVTAFAREIEAGRAVPYLGKHATEMETLIKKLEAEPQYESANVNFVEVLKKDFAP